MGTSASVMKQPARPYFSTSSPPNYKQFPSPTDSLFGSSSDSGFSPEDGAPRYDGPLNFRDGGASMDSAECAFDGSTNQPWSLPRSSDSFNGGPLFEHDQRGPVDLEMVTPKKMEIPLAEPFGKEDDGYQWKKYGNKLSKKVRRSYFKCSHPDCEAKKIVEVSTEEDHTPSAPVYKGLHNHERPSITHRKIHTQQQLKDIVIMATTTVVEAPDPSAPAPKVVLRMSTNLDPGEDGFSWRKYGRKAVKGNPHPRCYYRCAHEPCPVKKHVEQHGETYVCSYECLHEHDDPPVVDLAQFAQTPTGEKRQRQDNWDQQNLFTLDQTGPGQATLDAFGHPTSKSQRVSDRR